MYTTKYRPPRQYPDEDDDDYYYRCLKDERCAIAEGRMYGDNDKNIWCPPKLCARAPSYKPEGWGTYRKNLMLGIKQGFNPLAERHDPPSEDEIWEQRMLPCSYDGTWYNVERKCIVNAGINDDMTGWLKNLYPDSTLVLIPSCDDTQCQRQDHIHCYIDYCLWKAKIDHGEDTSPVPKIVL